MSTIETIKDKYLQRVRAEFPNLIGDTVTEEEVWKYVLDYFPHYKERVRTWDKLEYTFLGIGITRTSTTAVKKWLVSNAAFLEKFEQHSSEVQEKLKYIKSNRNKITPILEDINSLLEKHILGGRSVRGQANTLRRKLARLAKQTLTEDDTEA